MVLARSEDQFDQLRESDVLEEMRSRVALPATQFDQLQQIAAKCLQTMDGVAQ